MMTGYRTVLHQSKSKQRVVVVTELLEGRHHVVLVGAMILTCGEPGGAFFGTPGGAGCADWVGEPDFYHGLDDWQCDDVCGTIRTI